MNYLAHAFLSLGQNQIQVGNIISDFIKGRLQYSYPSLVLYGIKLHRSIDTFTDAHPATHKARTFFSEAYGLYSGAYVDIVYDHFLANDVNFFGSDAHLAVFAEQTYQNLQRHVHLLPASFVPAFQSMRKHNWLYNYRLMYGVERSFEGLVYRSKYMTSSSAAILSFHKNYEQLQICYNQFITDLDGYVKQWSYT